MTDPQPMAATDEFHREVPLKPILRSDLPIPVISGAFACPTPMGLMVTYLFMDLHAPEDSVMSINDTTGKTANKFNAVLRRRVETAFMAEPDAMIEIGTYLIEHAMKLKAMVAKSGEPAKE